MPTIAELLGKGSGPISFGVGDNVVAADPEAHMTHELGDAVYVVMKVEEAPCTCELSPEHRSNVSWHTEECTVRAVEHHQWVTIVVNGKEHSFSGACLKQV